MRSLPVLCISMLLSFCGTFCLAQSEVTYRIEENISYISPDRIEDDYQKERCVLDIYYPEGLDSFMTVVWYHGGGLTRGEKFIPEELKEKGIAVIAVNYRFYPKISAPKYIEDAASSVAWTFENIEKYGGRKDRIYVSGHSAGGYLASMIGLDKSYLEVHNIDADDIAGLIPFSGHAITHFTVRKERNLKATDVVVDHLAPISHIRPDAPPYIIVSADRDRELFGRYEENAFMWRMMKLIGHKDVALYELDSYNHGDMYVPALGVLLKEMKRIDKKMNEGDMKE